MDSPHLLEMIKQRLFGCGRQHGNAVLLSFAVAHGDLVRGEVELFNAQPQSLARAPLN